MKIWNINKRAFSNCLLYQRTLFFRHQKQSLVLPEPTGVSNASIFHIFGLVLSLVELISGTAELPLCFTVVNILGAGEDLQL